MVRIEKGQKYKRKIFMAMMFTFISGYIDVLGLVSVGGMFLSFMSGNTTRFSLNLSLGDFAAALPYIIIIGAFVLGSFIGGFIKQFVKKEILIAVLISDILLISLSIGLHFLGMSWLIYIPLTMAMGLQNIAQIKIDNIVIGKTFASGTLHGLGVSLAKVFMKKEKILTPIMYFSAWLALIFGTLMGALFHQWVGFEVALGMLIAALIILLAWVAYLEKIGNDHLVDSEQ